MNILITGGLGFIGSHLVKLLINEGHKVYVIDKKAIDFHPLEGTQNFKFFQADILNIEMIDPYFAHIDIVFHFAAKIDVMESFQYPQEYYLTNCVGTYNILKCCLKHKIKKVIYASSCCYYREVETAITEKEDICFRHSYAFTKFLGEQLLLHFGEIYHLPVISLRLFNVYGYSRTPQSYSNVIRIFLEKKRNNQPLPIEGDGEQTRDFIHVNDVVKAFYQAAISPHEGEIFNIGTGKPTSINELAAIIGGKISHHSQRKNEIQKIYAEISKSQQLLNFVPSLSLKEEIDALYEKMF